MHELLGILPDLRCVGAEGKPQSNQVRLVRKNECIRYFAHKFSAATPTRIKIAAQKYMRDFTVDW